MKYLLTITFALAQLRSTVAHYTFPYLIANETIHPYFKYVRMVSDETNKLRNLYPPMYDLRSIDIRCGRNATRSGVDTDVAVVVAGSKVGFKVDYAIIGKGWTSFHDGPLFAYLAAAPEQSKESLQRWDGDGEYFKIAQRGPDSSKGWWKNLGDIQWSEYNFTIPLTTPPGFYLLRMESIFPKPTFNTSQFYAACAQVEIVGPGGGNPGPMVRFPGAFDEHDEGILIPEELYSPNRLGGDLLTYKMPGPKIWSS